MIFYRKILLSFFIALLSLSGCTEDALPPAMQIEGRWGTQHVILIADKTGGLLEYDCAHGTIDESLIPNADGRFIFSGSHTWESGGPIQIDQEDTHPARYEGHVSKNILTFSVTLTDSNEILGPFTLIKDEQGRVFKCL